MSAATATHFIVHFPATDERVRCDTYPEAVALLKQWGCAVVGHAGDMADGGTETFAWLKSANTTPHASITARYSPAAASILLGPVHWGGAGEADGPTRERLLEENTAMRLVLEAFVEVPVEDLPRAREEVAALLKELGR